MFLSSSKFEVVWVYSFTNEKNNELFTGIINETLFEPIFGITSLLTIDG